MMASEFARILQAAVDTHGDYELRVGYDGGQEEVEYAPVDPYDEDNRGDSGWGPRRLQLVPLMNDSGGKIVGRCFQI